MKVSRIEQRLMGVTMATTWDSVSPKLLVTFLVICTLFISSLFFLLPPPFRSLSFSPGFSFLFFCVKVVGPPVLSRACFSPLKIFGEKSENCFCKRLDDE